jgi:DNA polymerase III subunit delta'
MTLPIGHGTQIAEVLAAAQGARMHHAWLFSGNKGIGKASSAQALATRILAQAAPPSADWPLEPQSLQVPEQHPIARLIVAGSHPDFITLKRLEKDKASLARNISVAQIRALAPVFALAPALSPRRIVIIDAADDMETSSANALLKSLEEPPAHTLFFLISHAPARLLPTIRSRCRVVRFAPLSESLMERALNSLLPDIAEGERHALLAASEGAPGKALALHGLEIAALEAELERIATSGDPHNALRIRLGEELAGKSAVPRYHAFLTLVPHYIAAKAHTRQGAALHRALEAYSQAVELTRTAPLHNLSVQAAVFACCDIVATLHTS